MCMYNNVMIQHTCDVQPSTCIHIFIHRPQIYEDRTAFLETHAPHTPLYDGADDPDAGCTMSMSSRGTAAGPSDPAGAHRTIS